MDILEELKRLVERLDEEKIQYALCGGLAMAIYALPRATLDIDIMIESDSLEKTSRAIDVLGFNLILLRQINYADFVQLLDITAVSTGKSL